MYIYIEEYCYVYMYIYPIEKIHAFSLKSCIFSDNRIKMRRKVLWGGFG